MHKGPGNYRFFPLHFLPIFCFTVHFLRGKNDINIHKYKFLALFFTLFIGLNGNPLSSAPKNRRFAVRSIRFLTKGGFLGRSAWRSMNGTFENGTVGLTSDVP